MGVWGSVDVGKLKELFDGVKDGRDANVWFHVGGCAIRDDEWTRVSWVEEGCVQDEQILRIREH